MNDDQYAVEKDILIQEVTGLRDRLEELGLTLSGTLTDEVLHSASWEQLRRWKTAFDRLVRSLSAGIR